MVFRELVVAAAVLVPQPSRREKAAGRHVVLESQQERCGHGKAEAGKRCTQVEEAFSRGNGREICLPVNKSGRGCDREARLRPRDAPAASPRLPGADAMDRT